MKWTNRAFGLISLTLGLLLLFMTWRERPANVLNVGTLAALLFLVNGVVRIMMSREHE